MWSVLFATARGDKTIDRFDCNIQQLSRYIGKAGALTGQIAITNPAIGARCQALAGRAGQLTAYVYYGAELWWGGLVNTTPLTSGRKGVFMDFAAATFESYLDRREVRADNFWSGIEQVEYLRTAWNTVQNTADGNLGISVPAVTSTGTPRDLTVLRSEARTWGSVVKEVSNRAGGYEWIIDFYDDGQGNRYRTLNVGYPQIGRAQFQQVITYPGKIVEYTIDRDALAGATSFQSQGDSVAPPPANGSTSQQPLMSTLGAYDATDLLNNGHLRFDATVNRQGVKDLATLNGYTGQDLAVHGGAVPIVDISVIPGGFNQSILGTVFQAQIDDYAFPAGPNGAPGYIGWHRCIGYEVKPFQHGAVDEIHLIIEPH
jgi:hypothetical protein